MKLAHLAALPIIALGAGVSHADDISYSYVEAGYVRVNFDDIDEDADGFLIGGSVEITESLFLYASYANVSLSIGGFDIDEQDYGVGLGYGWAVSDTVNVYGKAGYIRAEADVLGFNVDDDGYSLAIGVRARVARHVELEGAIAYADLSDSGDNTSVGVGIRYYFTEQFAVGLQGSFGDDSNTYGAGIRWQWGK